MTAALLDLDGTLVDSNYQHTLAWYRAFRGAGILLPVWKIHRAIGMGGDQLVRAMTSEQLDERLGEELRIAAPGARELADGWTTADDVEASKPEPDIIHAALAKAGTEDAVMIGDSRWDVEAAKRAKVATIGVLTGGWAAEELLDAGAVAVYESLHELRERLDETPLAG